MEGPFEPFDPRRAPIRQASTASATRTRHDWSVEGRHNERELYRQIIRRAKRGRERAAEALRRSRAQDLEEQTTAARRRRRLRLKG